MHPPLYLLPILMLVGGCATPWRTSAVAGIQTTASAIDARTVELTTAVEMLYVQRALVTPDPAARVGEAFNATWAVQLFPLDTTLSPQEFEGVLLQVDDAALAYPAALAEVKGAAWTGTQANLALSSCRTLSKEISATTTSLAAYYTLPPLTESTATLATQLSTLLEVEAARLQQEGGTP